MNFDLAKRNRLKDKFDFNVRDWQFELDGLEDFPPIPRRKGRPKHSTLQQQRGVDSNPQENKKQEHAGS